MRRSEFTERTLALSRKAKGKENKPGISWPGLFARTPAHTRIREKFLRRSVELTVEDALTAFGGKRRDPRFDKYPERDRCDERLWARFAWKYGYHTLQDAIHQGLSEIKQHDSPVAPADKPAILQNILNNYWRREGRA